MQTTHDPARRATTAIAAVLALSFTPVLAQNASTEVLDGPIINVPPVSTTSTVEPATMPAAARASRPAPVLVLPDVSAESAPAPAVPVMQPSPGAAARTTTARPVMQTGQAPELARSKPVSTVPAVTNQGEPIADDIVANDGREEILPPVAAADPAPTAQPAPQQSEDVTELLALVLVALLGLVAAIFAFAMLRRRRSAILAAAPKVAAPRKPFTEPVAPVASVAGPVPMTESVPVLDRAPASALASEGAAVPLPSRVPATIEERDALLKRMLDAKPDRANPFINRRARLHRARLILQSLGRKFENARPWIDLSDYPNNWPALARRRADARAAFAPAPYRVLEPA